MATYAGAKYTADHRAAKIRYKTLTGTVKKSGSGVARNVIIYKVGYPEIVAGEAISTSGVFSISVAAGSNDRFRIISIGEGDENSEIFEDVSAEAA